jgi:hypothetical protein
MRSILVVAWREIIEHQMFIVAASAALLLTLLVPLVSGLFNASRSDVLVILMVCMAGGFTLLCAAGLGASTVAGSLATGRLGFFLARPLSGSAIWLGKLIGVMAVVLGCEAIICAPAWIPFVRDSVANPLQSLDLLPYQIEEFAEVIGLFGFVLIPLVIVLVAHAVATMWRGRSAWLILNLFTVLVGAAGGWVTLRPLIENGAEFAATVVMSTLGVALIAVLVGAPVVQLTHGGVDIRSHHRFLSVTLAPTVVLLFAAAGGYVGWLTTPSAADVLKGFVSAVNAGPNGRWVAVWGTPAGRLEYRASYLIDLESSGSLRIDAREGYRCNGVDFSDDGSRVAWLSSEGDVCQVVYADLDALPLRTQGTTLFVSNEARFRLSPDGGRVAIVDDGLLSVATFPAGESLASTTVVEGYWSRLVFGSDGVVRFGEQRWSSQSGSWVSFEIEFDPSTESFRRIQRTEQESEQLQRVGEDPARDRLLVLDRTGEHAIWRYVNESTLEDVVWTVKRPLGSPVELLADGRLVDLVREGRYRRLEVLTPDGEVVATFPLPPVVEVGIWHAHETSVWFGGQPAPGRLVVHLRPPSASATLYEPSSDQDVRSILLDVDDGTAEELGRAVFRIANSTSPVGSPASRLFELGDGSVALWNPHTGGMEDLASRYE